MSDSDTIPFNRPWVDEADIERVGDVLRSGWWTTGSMTKQFESSFAAYVGVEHAVALNSCTAALHVALVALGVSAGDLVVTTTLTFAATAEVALYLGAIPVLLDVEPSTLNISAVQVEALCAALAAAEPRAAVLEAVRSGSLPDGVLRSLPEGASIEDVKAIIPVHYAGQACEMDAIAAMAEQYRIPIIEDAAHAAECTYGTRHAGSLGDVGAFSFYATKNLSTGEGGMATTNDAALADRMRSLSLHGISRDAWNRYSAAGSWRYDILEPGFKYNMTDVAAALGVGQLARLDQLHARREQIVRQYGDLLSGVDGLRTPQVVTAGTHAWHLYVVRIESAGDSTRRDALIPRMQARGIGTSVHFIPLHVHPYYRDRFGYQPGDFPVADKAFDEILSLPLYPSLTDDEVRRVADSVIEDLREIRAGG